MTRFVIHFLMYVLVYLSIYTYPKSGLVSYAIISTFENLLSHNNELVNNNNDDDVVVADNNVYCYSLLYYV